MAQPVIIEAVRTPIGKRNGWLSGLRAPDLLGAVQVEVVKRAGIDPASVEQIVGGCVTQAGEQGFNVTRTAWLLSGLPYEVAATTVDCQCGSSQQANHIVGQPDRGRRGRRRHRLRRRGDEPRAAGRQRVGAGRRPGHAPGPAVRHAGPVHRGGADRQEVRHHPRRRRLVRPGVAAQGHRGRGRGRFAREIVPVEAPIVGEEGPRGEHAGEKIVVSKDQGPRDTTAEGLAKLKPVLPEGMHTAGNSSQISDGAAAVLWMSEERAKAEGLKPRARVVARCSWAPTPTTTSTARSRPRPRCWPRPA